MEHIYIDDIDKLAGTGRYLTVVFMSPDGTTVMFTLEETETHEAFITRHHLELVGLCGTTSDGPQFVEQRPLPSNVKAAIGAHYRMYVERKRAESLNATQVQPASDYDFLARRYH